MTAIIGPTIRRSQPKYVVRQPLNPAIESPRVSFRRPSSIGQSLLADMADDVVDPERGTF
jgi:hypothetical protein